MMEEEAAEIRAKEREMASIKARISSLSDAKRQASSAEEQLGEVVQEVARLRERLAHVELELKGAASRKKDAEKDIADLERGMATFKETLHLRQLSVAELRSNRDETERQLAQTLRERELFRESATKAQQGFDTEAKSASAELDRWRSEAQELASALEALDVQKKELQQKASSEDSEKAFVASLQKELDEAIAAYAAFEEQNRSDDVNLAAAEAQQRDAETRLREAEQAANDLRSELQEEGEGARTATEAVKRELAVQVSKVAQLEGSLGENRNQLKTIQRHVDSLTQDLLDRTVKSAEDEEAVTSLSKQLQQEEQALERLHSEKEKLETAAAEEMKRAEECRRSKQALEDQQIHVELAQRSDVLSTTRTQATMELTGAVAEIAQLQQAQQQLDQEVAEVDLAAQNVERSRQEAKQKIEKTQTALEALSKKKSLRTEALEAKSRHLASLEEELSRRRQEVQSASAAALKLRASAARTAMESEMKEEALLQRFVQLKSELEEHQELSKQQDEEQKAVLEKLSEAQKKAPEKQVQARLAREKKDELEQMLLDLRSSLDTAKSTAKAEARKTRHAEEQIDRQRQELEALLADAAQQEVLAQALKSTLNEQKAEHEKFMEAHHGRASTSKDAELKVAEQVSELRVRRAELALKQEAVAAACSVEKERLAELRREFEKVRAGSLQKIEDAKKELQQDAMAKDLQALKTHEAEAASLQRQIEAMKAKQEELLRKAESGKDDLPDGGDKHAEDAESRKSQLLKELLSQRAASLQEASKESREAEMKHEALQKDQKHHQEEYRSVMEQMKSQVSQGNELYSKLQEVEQDIRTLEDESDLLALGLHEAESQKAKLEKEIVLVQQQAMGQFTGDLQTWAQEVQSLRVTAKVQSHEDELLHWKQAASESPAIASQLQVQAAEGLLRQKASALQDQLASKEKLLQELEQQAQSEEVAGSIRSVPSALHGSLTMGATLSVKAAAARF